MLRSLDEAQTSNTENERKVKERDEEINQLKEQIYNLRKLYTKSEKEAKDFSEEEYKEMETLEAYAAKLRTRLDNYEQALSAAPSRQELIEKESELKRLSKQLADISREADVQGEQYEKEMNALREKLANYERCSEQQSQKIETMKNQASSLEKRLRQYEQHWNDAEGAENEAEIELQIAQSRIRELENVLQSYRGKIDSLHGTIEFEKERCNIMKREYHEELTTVRQESNEMIRKLEEQLQLWKYQIRKKLLDFLPSDSGFPYQSPDERIHHSDHAMLEALKTLPRIKQWFLDVCDRHNEFASQKWHSLTKKNEWLEKSLDKMERKFQDIERSVIQERQQKKHFQLRIEELVRENASLSEKLKHKDSEIGALRHSCDETASKLKEYEEKFDHYEHDIRDYEKQLEDWKQWGQSTESCLRRTARERDDLLNTQQDFVDRVNCLQNSAGLSYDLSSREAGSEVMKALGALESSFLQPKPEPVSGIPPHLRESLDANVDRLGLIVRDIERLFDQSYKVALKLSKEQGSLTSHRQILSQILEQNQQLLQSTQRLGREFYSSYEEIREHLVKSSSPWKRVGVNGTSKARSPTQTKMNQYEFDDRLQQTRGHTTGIGEEFLPQRQNVTQVSAHEESDKDTVRQLHSDMSRRFEELGSRLSETSRKVTLGRE